MPLNLRASTKLRQFNVGVSYKLGDNSGKFLDARNVNTVQNRLDTRHGTSRYNSTALPGRIRSLSYFEKSDGSRYIIALVNQSLYAVNESGAHVELAVQMPETGLHRGVTENDRHLITVEGDPGFGLYSFNGNPEQFSVLGQAAPIIIPTGTPGTGESLPASDYKVAYTFYASSIGFESNATESASITVAANGKITVSNLQPTATNNLIDKIYIYLKDVTANGVYLFVAEAPLGTTSYVITESTLSTIQPPTKNAPPIAGGGKYLASFGAKTVYAGNSSFPNDVFFSEDYLPDAFDNTGDQVVLSISGDGAITGLATGLFSDSHLSPYLTIFKKKSTHIYSDLLGDGVGNLVTINDKIGCVSQDTIVQKNGIVYFLSEEGWRAISGGRLITGTNGEPVTLANGDIDDIFKSPGNVYEVNRSKVDESFAVYYPALDQYMTWVAEGVNTSFTKTYVYEFDVGGFKPWEFAVPATCACVAKDSSGRDIVLMGTDAGYVMRHSMYEERTDKDASNADVAIPAYGIFPYIPNDPDFDATYNFRELIVHSVNEGTVDIKTFLNYTTAQVEPGSITFDAEDEGFILDESLLDEGVFGDERSIKTGRFDVNRVGISIAFGFYQSEINGNMGLVSLQMDLSKNGNRNVATADSSDDVFGDSADSLYPDVSNNALLDEINGVKARVTVLELEPDLSVLEFNTDSEFPVEGRAETIYIDKSTNETYRWDTDTEVYILIGGGGGSGGSVETSKISLINNSVNTLSAIGEYLSTASSLLVDYYLYRRTDSGNARLSGRIRMNARPDGATNPDKWELVEEIRSESGASGVTFSLDDVDTEKSVLVATLDNNVGAAHSCVFYYKLTKLLEIGDQKVFANNTTTDIPEIEADLSVSRAKIIDYYLYRAVTGTSFRMSGKIIMEGVSDSSTWDIVELERSENGGNSGVSFSINDQGGGVANLEATLDNLAGIGHECKFYYEVTDLPV